MRRPMRYLPSLIVVSAVALILAGCPAPEPEPDPVVDEPPVAENDVRVFEAELEEMEGSGVTGTATIIVYGGRIEARVMAHGLDPDQRVPQHVHMSATCAEPGGILLNLDADLTHANEAAPRGDHYPTADGDGMLDYHASRSLEDMRDAAREYEGTSIEQLDLGNRVVNLHGPDMRAIACGALEARPEADIGHTQPIR
jgi:hypothetical protein